MSTGLESFANPATITAMYPFPGSEGFLVIVGVALWIIWHIWEIGFEAGENRKSVEKARQLGIK
jgi:uncharacterized membrane protein